MRFAYEPLPILAPSNVPLVYASTGLGTKGAAGIRLRADNGAAGRIFLRTGLDWTPAGSVTLQFPLGVPALFIAADQRLGTVTPTIFSNRWTLSWAAANLAVGPRDVDIDFEWAASN